MSQVMEEEIKRWTARRKSALIVLALYEFEVDKYNVRQPCGERVRAEDAAAAPD
jgi:hypothetical protein